MKHPNRKQHGDCSSRGLWMFFLPKEDKPGAVAELAAHGYSAVVIFHDDEIGAQLCQKAGLRAYAVIKLPDLGTGDESSMLFNFLGERIPWFGCGCPNAPAVQEFRHATVNKILMQPWWDGLFLDVVRFASPYNGTKAFFSCFCSHCKTAAERLGYDFDRICQDVKRLATKVMSGDGKRVRQPGNAGSATEVLELLLTHPGILDWLRFKIDCITEHVADVRRVFGDSSSKLLGAYLYPPSLAPLVGQSYSRLAPLLDIVSPILLRLGEGNSVFGSELSGLACLVAAALGMSRARSEKLVLNLVGLGGISLVSPAKGVAAGLGPKVFRREVARAAARIGEAADLVPAIWMDDPLFDETIGECRSMDGLCASILDETTRKCIPAVAQAWQHAGF